MDDRAAPIDLETRAAERPGDHKAELRLWLRLLTCANLIESDVRRRLRETFDVTLPRFDLMAQLDKVPDGMTLGELSRRLMVSNGNVTAIVEALVGAGLVDRRAADGDRRTQLVRLTQDGRATFHAMASAHENWIADLFEGLSPADIDTLMVLLAKAKASARRATERH
jgi:DNA-binding MarR family transcriptional regulator